MSELVRMDARQLARYGSYGVERRCVTHGCAIALGDLYVDAGTALYCAEHAVTRLTEQADSGRRIAARLDERAARLRAEIALDGLERAAAAPDGSEGGTALHGAGEGVSEA